MARAGKILARLTPTLHIIKPYIHFNFSCWLDTENGLIYAFVVPMATVLLINTIMFIVALRIAKNSIQKRGEGAEKTLALMKGLFTIL